jgi:hypothetical protein
MRHDLLQERAPPVPEDGGEQRSKRCVRQPRGQPVTYITRGLGRCRDPTADPAVPGSRVPGPGSKCPGGTWCRELIVEVHRGTGVPAPAEAVGRTS